MLERYQRRTVRLSEQLRSVVRELAGRAAARLLPVMGIVAGKDTAVRALLGIALPERPLPRVLGIDDFALRRSRSTRAAPRTSTDISHPGARRAYC